MKIRKYDSEMLLIRIEDEDAYRVTDGNGVDFWPTKKQIEQIIKKGAP
jgi:hypothetical protein